MSRIVHITLRHTVDFRYVGFHTYRSTDLLTHLETLRPETGTVTITLPCDHCRRKVQATVQSPPVLAARRRKLALIGAGLAVGFLLCVALFYTGSQDSDLAGLTMLGFVAGILLLPWSISMFAGVGKETGVELVGPNALKRGGRAAHDTRSWSHTVSIATPDPPEE